MPSHSGVGERRLHRGTELRSAARVDGLVDGVAGQHNLERKQVGGAVLHDERVPVLQRVAFVAGLSIEREVGVGPGQTFAQTCRCTVGAEVARALLPYVVGVVLVGEVGLQGEGIGLAAAEPGIGEAQRQGLVVGAVGLSRDREALVLAHRIGTPGALLEEVADREVVERDAHRSHEGARAPAAGDVELVGGLFFERPVDVDQFVRDGPDVGGDVLGVEVAHRTQETQRAHEQRAVVEFAGVDAHLAADHLVVDALVARDAYVVDGELLAFEDLHLDVDRVGPRWSRPVRSAT